jgi:hypothetical protein
VEQPAPRRTSAIGARAGRPIAQATDAVPKEIAARFDGEILAEAAARYGTPAELLRDGYRSLGTGESMLVDKMASVLSRPKD